MQRFLLRAKTFRLLQIGAAGFLVIGLVAIGLVSVARADTIIRGFNSQTPIQPDWIVALNQKVNNAVELAPANNSSRMFGVSIDPSQAPATVQNQGQQVFVATSGAYPVLVSNQSGVIRPGDYISMSKIDGIGAKASSQQSYALGQALEGFDGKSGVITTGSDGSAIGRIQVSIIPGKNPLFSNDIGIPAPLKKIGNLIAGKDVSATRLYAAVTVFVVTSVVAVVILGVGIRSAMIAIGRNPLSRQSILRNVFQVVFVGILVFITGIFAVYLLLKL